jgi:hypothetical protein
MGRTKKDLEAEEFDQDGNTPEELIQENDFLICAPDVEELRMIMKELEGTVPEVAARIKEVLNSLVEI